MMKETSLHNAPTASPPEIKIKMTVIKKKNKNNTVIFTLVKQRYFNNTKTGITYLLYILQYSIVCLLMKIMLLKSDELSHRVSCGTSSDQGTYGVNSRITPFLQPYYHLLIVFYELFLPHFETDKVKSEIYVCLKNI